jgi:hypothetical protein
MSRVSARIAGRQPGRGRLAASGRLERVRPPEATARARVLACRPRAGAAGPEQRKAEGPRRRAWRTLWRDLTETSVEDPPWPAKMSTFRERSLHTVTGMKKVNGLGLFQQQRGNRHRRARMRGTPQSSTATAALARKPPNKPPTSSHPNCTQTNLKPVCL